MEILFVSIFLTLLLFCRFFSMRKSALVAFLLCQGMSLAASKDVVMVIELQPKQSAVAGKEAAPSDSDMQKVVSWLDKCLDLLKVNGGIITRQSHQVLIHIPKTQIDKIEKLQSVLTVSHHLELLPVHRDSETIINKPEVQALIKKYEEKKKAHLAAAKSDEPLAQVIYFPASFNLSEYMILEEQRLDEQDEIVINEETGMPAVRYVVVERPSTLSDQGLYISGANVEFAGPNWHNNGSVWLTLDEEGGKKMESLTESMESGVDRIAIVVNNQIMYSPVVQGILSKDFMISGIKNRIEFCIALTRPSSGKLNLVEIRHP